MYQRTIKIIQLDLSFDLQKKNEEGKYGTYYMVKIEHLRDSDNFRFTLQTGGPDPNKKEKTWSGYV